MLGKLARPVWGWGPGAIPGPTPLFVASETGGRRAAILFSLVASCKANQVEPLAYLRDIFTRLPAIDTSPALEALLPDHWLQAHPAHRWEIATLRKQERRARK
jgi:transposase